MLYLIPYEELIFKSYRVLKYYNVLCQRLYHRNTIKMMENFANVNNNK